MFLVVASVFVSLVGRFVSICMFFVFCGIVFVNRSRDPSALVAIFFSVFCVILIVVKESRW